MQPYAARYISQNDIELLEKVRLLFENLPEIDLGQDGRGERIIVSCHSLARAVNPFFPVTYVYGIYATLYQHSWLTTRSGAVIDIYPVGCVGGPVLVATEVYKLSRLYEPRKLPLRKRFSQESRELARQVTVIRRAVRQTIRKLGIKFCFCGKSLPPPPLPETGDWGDWGCATCGKKYCQDCGAPLDLNDECTRHIALDCR